MPQLTDTLLDRFIVIPEVKLLFCYIEKVKRQRATFAAPYDRMTHQKRKLPMLPPILREWRTATHGACLLSLAVSFFPQPGCVNCHLNPCALMPFSQVGALTFNSLFANLQFQFDLAKNQKAEGRGVWFSNTPAKFGMERSDLEAALVNPAWTKAVFYRDPVVRFLSGFRSKCEAGHDEDWSHCSITFGERWPSFSAAVARMAVPEPRVEDEHFRPQAEFCGGLETTLAHYDFVSELTTPEAMRADTVALLHAVGVNELTVPGFNQLFPLLPPPEEPEPDDVPPSRHVRRLVDFALFSPSSPAPQFSRALTATEAEATSAEITATTEPAAAPLVGVVRNSVHEHATHAKASLCNYYTDAAMVLVIEEFYRRDYDLFGMTPVDICGF
ncbi:unnamed protein product [Phaeothamnion confervicola]